MNDTPRTDAAEVEDDRMDMTVSSDFARQLERELAEARAELKRKDEALEPLAKYLDGLGSVWAKLDSFADDTTAIVLLGDLRRAARALKGQP